tara:strand:- start:3022 stop:3144 length:123 start_codon:yes stop_codon:yes gene_type:complete
LGEVNVSRFGKLASLIVDVRFESIPVDHDRPLLAESCPLT